MARPQKRTVDYFPHDGRASEGDTITIIEGQFGLDGYAFWFKLLERLSTVENHVIDCRNPVKRQLLMAKVKIPEEKGLAILNRLAELGAIDAELWEHRLIWCQNLVTNVTDVYRNRHQPPPKRPEVPVSTSDNPVTTNGNTVSTPPSTPLLPPTPPIITQSKLNKSKVKGGTGGGTHKQGNDGNKTAYGEAGNVCLTLEEHGKLVKKFGEASAKERIDHLSHYIASSGHKYDSHYYTILKWHDMDLKKLGQTSVPGPPLTSAQVLKASWGVEDTS